MWRVLTLVVVFAAAACASAGAPPGGPERHTPPAILAITPESGTTGIRPKEVEFRFDEVVSDRPSGTAADLSQLFLISPRTGDPSVSWHRTRITVRPHGGFRPNTAYMITLLPGLADLRGNVRKDGSATLFSTGPSFPPYSILGTAFDWAARGTARGAVLEAISHPDTTVVYMAASDSAGNFELGPLPAGTYTMLGFIDQNSNRIRDRNEKWDSTTVVVTDTRPHVELDMIERDSVPPVFETIKVDDSVTLHVSFDKYLDPKTSLQPTMIRLQRPDSSALQVTRVQWASAFDSTEQARRTDSLRRADTSATARGDTSAAGRRPRPDTSAASRRAEPAPPAPARGGAAPAGPRGAPPPPKPKAPPPEKVIVVSLSPATPLEPAATYRITATGLRNLVGNTHEITRTFTVPKPAPPDTSKKKTVPDTTRRPPPKKPPL